MYYNPLLLCFISQVQSDVRIMLKTFSRDLNNLKQSLLRASSSYHVYPFQQTSMQWDILPKQVDREFIDKSGSWLWRQTLTISITWLCLLNRKAERTWSHSFLLADFAGTVCCSHFGVWGQPFFVKAPNTSTESFLLHSAMMESIMLPLKLSCTDFPWIRVRFLLFTE